MPTSKAGSLDFLPGFTRLSSSVYYHSGAPVSQRSGTSPSASTSAFLSSNSATSLASIPTPHKDSPPDLIILLSWGGAAVRNVAKYAAEYSTLFPSSPILLSTTEFSDLVLHGPTSQDAKLSPAISAILNITATPTRPETASARDGSVAQPTHPSILVHLFSNAGSYKLIELCKRYRSATGSVLPVTTLVIDSAPGVANWQRNIAAFSATLPKSPFLRYPGYVLISLLMLLIFVKNTLLRQTVLIDVVRGELNDSSLVDIRGQRCYIYSESDALVGSEDVHRHVNTARERGYAVKEEVFVGSKHVAHAVLDGARYWQAVIEMWDRSLGSK